VNAHVPAPALGVYPLAEAARLAQLDRSTARRWAQGYAFRYRGEARYSPGVVLLALPSIGSQVDLTFAELLTLRLVKGFKEAGLSLRTIKRVAEVASQHLGTLTPFVSRRFRTDGRKVFEEVQHLAPNNDEPSVPRRERELIEVLSGQRQFADIVEPSLYANVEWSEDVASRWWPLGMARGVVLEPGIACGAPRIAHTRLTTAAIAAAVVAEGGGEDAMAAVAKWYEIALGQVRDAVDFETGWLRRAA
jgi:uncharacterized protein (DUF433 family)